MNPFEKLYEELKEKHGTPAGQWKLWCKRPKSRQEKEEVIIGAILTQRTNWKNVELAIGNLKNAKINSLKDIYQLGLKDMRELASLLKPSGFYQMKAEYLFHLADFILKKYICVEKMKEAELDKLKEELLEQKGVGPETRDSILLYALEKPVFVIDEYTRRLVRGKGLSENLSYNHLQRLFEENLKRDYELYQDFHALIVIDGKRANNYILHYRTS